MLGRYSVRATEDAARALAASRAFDPDRHDPNERCSVDAPCRYCCYDATAAVSAALVSIERQRSEEDAGRPLGHGSGSAAGSGAGAVQARIVDLASDRTTALAGRRSTRRA